MVLVRLMSTEVILMRLMSATRILVSITSQRSGAREARENGSDALFQQYLFAVENTLALEQASGPSPEPANDAHAPTHAVPHIINYHPKPNAGQPIRWVSSVNSQEQVTRHLADDANFQLADFINSLDLSSRAREMLFKLKLNKHLPWKNDNQFKADMNSLPHKPEMHECKVKVGEGEDAEEVEF
ncbi:hypothetical protein FRC12_001020 [Ceratobasidium sp. 428]|nr:hypothetical protein FRC12_001020 [Ceratobasidium sp. 428]